MPLPHLSLANLNAPAEEFTFRRDKYDLNPPYQRGSVWTTEQRINLVKSLYMGLPIGAVVINFRGYDVEGPAIYAVIDGKQRIETLRAFVDDQFAVPAEWFDPSDVTLTTVHNDDFDGPGVLFNDLSKKKQRAFENFAIATLKAQVATVAEEAVIFGLINAGGTAQTDTDLARAAQVATSKD